MTDFHQRRISPTLGHWINVLLLQAHCPDCGEILGDKKNCQFDHDVALADRLDISKWAGIHPNDPKFAQIRHVDCHLAKTNKEHTARSKAKRLSKVSQAHRERMADFTLPAGKRPKPASRFGSRKLQSRPFAKEKNH